jgi:PmbA protein
MMKAATPNPEFKDLAHPAKKYSHVNDLYDPIINQITLDDIQSSLTSVFNLSRRSRPPNALSGGISPSIGVCYIWNTNGINCWEKTSSVGVEINVTLIQGKKVSFGTESEISMNWRDLNVKKIADQAYNIAYRGLKKISVPTGKYSVLLSPKAVDVFFLESITGAINAEAVQNHLSFLSDFRNKQIATKILTIKDEPHLAGRLGSGSFDDEGIATRPITVIENGILRELYHNTFTAGKEGISSNGHAARGSFAAPVRIAPHNVLVNPGTESWKDLLAEIKNGILFDYSGDRPNAITGDFSGLIMNGYRIKDGKVGTALQENMIGINLIDAMKQIEAISREREWRGNSCVPWIKLHDVAISGR